jgi:hypothetical protein
MSSEIRRLVEAEVTRQMASYFTRLDHLEERLGRFEKTVVGKINTLERTDTERERQMQLVTTANVNNQVVAVLNSQIEPKLAMMNRRINELAVDDSMVTDYRKRVMGCESDDSQQRDFSNHGRFAFDDNY